MNLPADIARKAPGMSEMGGMVRSVVAGSRFQAANRSSANKSSFVNIFNIEAVSKKS